MAEQSPGAHFFVTEKESIHHTREEFLANCTNKEQLIILLSVALTQDRHQVIECGMDADIQIIVETIDFACNRENVFSEDTDILISLCISGIVKWQRYLWHLRQKKQKQKEIVSQCAGRCGKSESTCCKEFAVYTCVEWTCVRNIN